MSETLTLNLHEFPYLPNTFKQLVVGVAANEYDDSHAFCKWQLGVEKNNKSGKYEEKHGEERLDEGYVLGLDTRI